MRPIVLFAMAGLAGLFAWDLAGQGAQPKAGPPAGKSAAIPFKAPDPVLLRKAAAARVAAESAAVFMAAMEEFVQGRKAAAQAAALKAATTKTEAAQAAAKMAQAALAVAQKQRALRLAPVQAAFNEAAQAEAAGLGGLQPLPANAWDLAKARHLLDRAGFGGTPEEVASLHALGLHLAVAHVLNFHKQPALPLPFDAVLPERPMPDEKFRSPQELKILESRRRSADFQQMSRLRQWWFQRMLQTPRPLQEKLTLFWHGHFTSEQRSVQNSYAMFRQNELFREHAAGNFGALLHGIIHDPAMLRYLDNNSNVKGKPNENLAREIMELFSMGAGQGYTEKDIMEGARALTGYTFDPYACQFRFLAKNHDNGPKTIFGKTGHYNGEDFVDLILQQPATPLFIARKLFTFFAHDKPDPEAVLQLASVLRNCDYELGPVLKNLFLSEEFYSPQAMGTQIKSPVQLVVGMYRELGIKDVGTQGLEFAVRSMGQDLFDPPNVKGWEGGRSWINANVLITRYNQLANLIDRPAFGRQPFRTNQPLGIDVVAMLGKIEFKTPAEVVDYLAQRHLTVPIPAQKRQELIAYLGNLPPSFQWGEQRNQVNAKLRGLLVLLFASPEYQMI